MLDHTTLYPGVRESLDRLRAEGLRMAVLTNKPEKISQDILAGLGVGGHFFRVRGGNTTVQKKPDPAGVQLLLEETGIPKERALMVGDSAVDVLTARNAGIAVCGVTYGFQPESLAGEPPDILVDRMQDLADMVVAERNLKGATRS
jgi:phosphoglycolate phosphatase